MDTQPIEHQPQKDAPPTEQEISKSVHVVIERLRTQFTTMSSAILSKSTAANLVDEMEARMKQLEKSLDEADPENSK